MRNLITVPVLLLMLLLSGCSGSGTTAQDVLSKVQSYVVTGCSFLPDPNSASALAAAYGLAADSPAAAYIAMASAVCTAVNAAGPRSTAPGGEKRAVQVQAPNGKVVEVHGDFVAAPPHQ